MRPTLQVDDASAAAAAAATASSPRARAWWCRRGSARASSRGGPRIVGAVPRTALSPAATTEPTRRRAPGAPPMAAAAAAAAIRKRQSRRRGRCATDCTAVGHGPRRRSVHLLRPCAFGITVRVEDAATASWQGTPLYNGRDYRDSHHPEDARCVALISNEWTGHWICATPDFAGELAWSLRCTMTRIHTRVIFIIYIDHTCPWKTLHCRISSSSSSFFLVRRTRPTRSSAAPRTRDCPPRSPTAPSTTPACDRPAARRRTPRVPNTPPLLPGSRRLVPAALP